ncbi:MAG: hypothetical protein M5U12_20585 [Verrucomicrobia bacterium]|nr:hypothetical protein [Verrucomicrobiota bacterium]
MGDRGWGQDQPPPRLTNAIAIAVSAGGWDSGGEHGLALLGDGVPTALRAPVRRLAFTGQEVGLNAGIVAAPPSTYQWRLNGTDRPDATNAFFVLADARPADSGVYEVAVTNPLGAIAVTHTVLHVWDQPPILTKQPAGQTTYPGATISLSVKAAFSVGLVVSLGYREFDQTNVPPV